MRNIQQRLSSPSGRGVPTVFELRVDGVIIAEQTFFYFASYSGGPPPEIRPSVRRKEGKNAQGASKKEKGRIRKSSTEIKVT